MRTAINASWLVGHDKGGHTLIRDGVVVYEDNRIISVGTGFDGSLDRTIDAKNKLVAPGFIDTHVHYGHRASHRLITDAGRPLFYGQPFLEITVPKKGKKVTRDARWINHGEAAPEAAGELNAADTLAGPPRNGVPTAACLRGAGRAGAGGAGCPPAGEAARAPRCARARIRLRPLGRRRIRPARAHPRRAARHQRPEDRDGLDRAPRRQSRRPHQGFSGA